MDAEVVAVEVGAAGTETADRAVTVEDTGTEPDDGRGTVVVDDVCGEEGVL